jgi:hypothetical protein
MIIYKPLHLVLQITNQCGVTAVIRSNTATCLTVSVTIGLQNAIYVTNRITFIAVVGCIRSDLTGFRYILSLFISTFLKRFRKTTKRY